ncbi:MAG: stage 0 sporulation protein [Christensenellaceae bacterium]|jgi:cell fate regulator YaaT (PSP1 superfamily)|nr:stage 0 sporulation protein [Christensenellaceae bacterium]
METVISVKFRNGQKALYFDPLDIEFKENDNVIVETIKGMEMGCVVGGNKEVEEKEIVRPLKPVIRKATADDVETNNKNLSERNSIIAAVNEKVTKHSMAIKIVDAEYTFDRNKIIVYFTAHSRIDFRELVRDIAAIYRVRIELRQIYERDDIRIRGALAVCGRPCCCIAQSQEYEKVGIKMAKVQCVSLNPSKISGCCGKLMCCLRYEYPYYQEVFKKMPKINSEAMTPSGNGVVVGHNMLKQEVKMRITTEDGGCEYRYFPLEKIISKHFQTIESASDEMIDE